MRISRKLGGACIALAAALLLSDRLLPPDLGRAAPSAVVRGGDGAMLRPFTTADGMWRLAAGPEDVDPLFLTMLTAYEDRRFGLHPGVDPLAVLRAAGQWLSRGEVVSGASTLTMQTARLLEPRPRGLASKMLEMLRAVQLEARLSKAEILSLYLTLAPYGGNIEGVRAASLAWLGKEPRHLTPAEAALLVVLPQSPARLRPDRHPDAARAARDKVLERMARLGVLTADQAAESRQDAIPRIRRDLPMLAPHLAERLRAQGIADSFIQTGLQRRLEQLAGQRRDLLDEDSSLAVLVVENAGRKVIGYVGAADYADVRRFGAIDMVRAVRSPGSTLKPMAYGMAFDDLSLHPGSLLRDEATNFGDYSPANFSKGFAGEVTAREALQQSLNIPAVAVLDKIGPLRFAARLREAGMTPRIPGGGQPGLPMILGGVGVTLEELAGLYAAMANGGDYRPLRLSPSQPEGESRPILGAAAAWYIEDILTGAPLPPNMAPDEGRQDRRRIAFKTGTSYGFRDAWAVGWDEAHTVAVWIGRPDGTPSPSRFGRNSAAPLLFDLFELLPRPQRSLIRRPPPPGVLADPPMPHQQTVKLAPATDPLAFAFPPDGATLAWSDARHGLQLTAKGGRLPLSWLIDGRPQPAADPWRSDIHWIPASPGASRITVIDAAGAAVTAEIWLE